MNCFSFAAALLLFIATAISQVVSFTSCISPRYVFDAGLCYYGCPPGYKGEGVVCRKQAGTTCASGFFGKDFCPSSVDRGVGTIPTECHLYGFRRTPLNTNPVFKGSFTMIIANDPQIHWWSDPEGAVACHGGFACTVKNAEKEALNQVKAMNGIESLGTWPGSARKITKPVGVIINGDLTSYFHSTELDAFEKYYVRMSNGPHEDVLNYPLYLGLGNHDYKNNLNDCWWHREPRYGVLGKNGCAQKAVDYIRGMVLCGMVPSFPANQVTSFHVGSMAYSWDMGKYHFIQLHNYPSYTAESLGVTSSMVWLEGDLKRAREAKKHIIVNLHDLDEHFKDPERKSMRALVEKYKVVGIFCGHNIGDGNLGYKGTFGGVPKFRGGHAGVKNRNKFLLVEFAHTYYRVLSISSSEGTPRVVSTSNSQFDMTISLDMN